MGLDEEFVDELGAVLAPEGFGVVQGAEAGGVGGLREQRAVVVEAGDAAGEGLGVGVGGEEAVEGVADGVLAGGGAEGDDGEGGGHGVEEGTAEVVGEVRHEEEVAVGEGVAEG